MRVTVEVTRTYEMDAARILANRHFNPPPADASDDDKEQWLRESFFELCGFEHDADHIDGSYVKLVDEDTYTEFDWPESLYARESDSG